MIKIDDNKYRFDIDCDISGYSVYSAYDFIQEELNPNFDPKKKLYFILKVPSQIFSDAIKISDVFGDCRVEIDFQYHEDEWSITGEYIDFSGEKYKTVSMIVWSPGA